MIDCRFHLFYARSHILRIILTAATNDLKDGRCLAEAHLRVPEHIVVLLETRQRISNRLLLLVAEFERIGLLQFGRVQRNAPLHDGGNGVLDRLKISLVPFAACRPLDLDMLVTRLLENVMDIVIAEERENLLAPPSVPSEQPAQHDGERT